LTGCLKHFLSGNVPPIPAISVPRYFGLQIILARFSSSSSSELTLLKRTFASSTLSASNNLMALTDSPSRSLKENEETLALQYAVMDATSLLFFALRYSSCIFRTKSLGAEFCAYAGGITKSAKANIYRISAPLVSPILARLLDVAGQGGRLLNRTNPCDHAAASNSSSTSDELPYALSPGMYFCPTVHFWLVRKHIPELL
jgi:hypothetical protein